jgi:HEAT repeat protein
MNAAVSSVVNVREESMHRNSANLNGARLGKFGISQSEAEHLVAMLSQSTQLSRRVIVSSLRQLGEAAILLLARQLADPCVATRQAAADALRQMVDTSAAVSELTAALFDTDWLVRIWSAEALGHAKVRNDHTIAALRHARRNDPLVYVRLSAESALRRIGDCA